VHGARRVSMCRCQQRRLCLLSGILWELGISWKLMFRGMIKIKMESFKFLSLINYKLLYLFLFLFNKYI
jgi:hypothetical protein